MSEVELTTHPAGVIIPVYAQPGARRNGLVGLHLGRLKIAVTAAPEKGKANTAIAAELAQLLSLPKSRVSLLSGDTHREKRFLVEGMLQDDIAAVISRSLADSTKASDR
jgi:uncharacterized protein (TIGR00251 family)